MIHNEHLRCSNVFDCVTTCVRKALDFTSEKKTSTDRARFVSWMPTSINSTSKSSKVREETKNHFQNLFSESGLFFRCSTPRVERRGGGRRQSHPAATKVRAATPAAPASAAQNSNLLQKQKKRNLEEGSQNKPDFRI
jgi:hypothetical protein